MVLTDRDEIISGTNLNGVINCFNDYFYEVTGFDREELVGKPYSSISESLGTMDQMSQRMRLWQRNSPVQPLK